MEHNRGAIILLTVLIVSAFLPILFKIAEAFVKFRRETRRAEMKQAADDDGYARRRKALRCQYLCRIPFATERNAARLYQRLCRRPQHAEKKRSGCLARLLAPSVIGACVCVVCLCGASWAWFTTAASTEAGEIQAAVYTVSVTAAPGEVTAKENGAAELTLDAGQTYTVTIEPTGTATSGYCRVCLAGEDDEKVYYTVQCASGKLTFTVYASENGTLTVTPEWGTCSVTSEDALIRDQGKIGTQAARTSTSEGTATEPQPTTPTDAAPPEESASAPDAPEALSESDADEE